VCQVCGTQKRIDSGTRFPRHRRSRDDTHLNGEQRDQSEAFLLQALHMRQGINTKRALQRDLLAMRASPASRHTWRPSGCVRLLSMRALDATRFIERYNCQYTAAGSGSKQQQRSVRSCGAAASCKLGAACAV
jgi:hypothetical protein